MGPRRGGVASSPTLPDGPVTTGSPHSSTRNCCRDPNPRRRWIVDPIRGHRSLFCELPSGNPTPSGRAGVIDQSVGSSRAIICRPCGARSLESIRHVGARRSRMSVHNLGGSDATSRTRAARPHASSCRACIPSIQTARTAPAVVEIRACPRACPLDRATCGSRGRWSRCPCPPSRRSRRGRGRPGGPVLGLTDLMPSWPRT